MTTIINQATSKLVAGIYDNGTGTLTPVNLKCASDGTLLVNGSSSGSSTSNTQEATQLLVKAAVQGINTKITAMNSGATVITSSALPTGAATDASVVSVKTSVDASTSQLTTANTNLAKFTFTSAGALVSHPAAPLPNADVALATHTTSGNSGAISIVSGGGISGKISVPTVSGTNPTLDIILQESYDGGANWDQIWAAPRITSPGVFNLPVMLSGGQRRWVWTIGGTTPSFQFSITTTGFAGVAPLVRKYIDRSISLTTLNSTTTPFYAGIIERLTVNVVTTALGSPAPTLQVEFSDDNTNWSPLGSPVLMTSASMIIYTGTGCMSGWFRVRTSTAGTGSTLNFVSITGTNF